MQTVALDTVLCVNDVSVVAKTTQILSNITFSSCSGDFLAVMGPSGAGKTTLLNAIAGRQPLSSGEITLSGKNFDKQLRRRLGFVLQQDVFFSRLTLWETLYFTAMIRLPEHISRAEKMERVDEIINMLDIRKCLNTVIGDMFVRGLSGGEKKRASIACELLTDPDILLIDEPTSGLDSSTALALTKQMKTLASKYNKTIIVSIHQPSSQIYQMFDTLLLLANGKIAYYGGADKEPMDFLEQFGYKCDAMYNPADFFLEVLKADQAKLDEIVCAFKKKNLTFMNELATKKEIDRNGILPNFNNANSDIVCSGYLKKSESTASIITKKYASGTLVTFDELEAGATKSSAQQRWSSGFCTQFRMLSWRNFKQSRGRILHLYDVIHNVVMTIIASVLFFQISSDAKASRDKMGVIFFCVTHWTFASAFEAILASEIKVVSKERAAGAYRLSAYYFAKTISELPMIAIMPTVLYGFVYWMAGLNGIREFFITWPIFIMSAFSAQGLGLFLGAIIPDVKIAFLTGNTIVITSLLFSGFITQSIPYWISWMKYLSHIHYPLSAICLVVFDNMEPLLCNDTSVKDDFPKCLQNDTAVITSKDILYEAGIVLPIYCYLGTFALILISFRVAAYLALRFKRHVPK